MLRLDMFRSVGLLGAAALAALPKPPKPAGASQ
jgi:hypothetical protein